MKVKKIDFGNRHHMLNAKIVLYISSTWLPRYFKHPVQWCCALQQHDLTLSKCNPRKYETALTGPQRIKTPENAERSPAEHSWISIFAQW